MIKALAIVAGTRQRTTEYLSAMRCGYYDLVFLMDNAKKPFAFMTLQNEVLIKVASAKLSAVFTVAARDVLNDPKAFEGDNVYIQKSHGTRSDYMVCKTGHLGALGFDETKIQVFLPERPGDVFRYANGAEGARFVQDIAASRTLQDAYGRISKSPPVRGSAPR